MIKRLVDTFIFGMLAIATFYAALWFKDYSFENGYFGVQSEQFGWDGIIVWLCLMMSFRLVHKIILDKLFNRSDQQ